jgi:hypothetical protein
MIHLHEDASGKVLLLEVQGSLGTLHLVSLRPSRSDGAPSARRRARTPRDLPGGGERMVRGAKGIDTVIVNGQIFWARGAYTESRAGRTV